MSFPITDFLIVTAIALTLVVLAMTGVAIAARRLGRVAIVDLVWGPGFVVVAGVSALVGELLGEGGPRAWLLFGLLALWGGRLARHIGVRAKGQGEDPRYEELLSTKPGGILRRVLLPQGGAIWFVSLPVQVSAVSGGSLGWVTLAGVALFAFGLGFESIGDAQLASYKQDPDREPVMDRGLWAWTRHPNYFGDACVWWGVWLIASESWPGVLTVLSPVAMTFFLVFATGARLLEKTMMKRQGYPEYAERTSMFFPLPPKRKASAG